MKKIKDREEAERRKRESHRKAVEKYEQNFKRINCRFESELFEQIQEKIKGSEQSVNTFIIEAVTEKIERN
jgi:predicted HicB family RNase H-like nuclease